MIVLDSSVYGPCTEFHSQDSSYLFRPLFFYYVRLYLSLYSNSLYAWPCNGIAVCYVQVYPTNYYL